MRIGLKFVSASVVSLSILLSSGPSLFAADPVDPRTVRDRLHYFHVAGVVSSQDGGQREASRDALLDVIDKNRHALMYYALTPSVIRDSQRRFLQALEDTRIDQQIGPGGGASSYVSKTGMVPILGLGIDSNDAQRTIDPNVLTLRMNVEGMSRFLSNQQTILTCSLDPTCPEPGRARDIEVWVSFNVSGAGATNLRGFRPSDDPEVAPEEVDFGASTRGGFANFTARIALDKRQGLRRVEYGERWIQWIQASDDMLRAGGRDFDNYLKLKLQQLQLIGPSGRVTRDSGETDQYTLWVRETREKLINAPLHEDEWERVLAAQLDVLLDKIERMDRDFDQRTLDFSKGYVRYLEARRTVEAETIIPETTSVLEYSYSEQPLQPRFHTLNFSRAYSLGNKATASPGIVTLNAGVNVYHNDQPSNEFGSMSRWRSAHAGLQFDRPIGAADSLAQLSVGAHYQYLSNPVIIVPPGANFTSSTQSVPAATALAVKQGSIFSAHATVIFRPSRTGIRLPIGISWASRSDLRVGQEVRGHIGFTFDSTPLALLPGGR